MTDKLKTEKPSDEREANLIYFKREGEPLVLVDLASAANRPDGTVAVILYSVDPPSPKTDEQRTELLTKEKIDIPCYPQGQFVMSHHGFHTILDVLNRHAKGMPKAPKQQPRLRKTKKK